MSFPYADTSLVTNDGSKLQLEFFLNNKMEYGDITFEKNEIIKMFEKLKFSSNKLISDWDQTILNYNIARAWAVVDSVLFYDDRIVLNLMILDTHVGKTYKAIWNNFEKEEHRFFVSLTHTGGKSLSFLTIDYSPNFKPAVPSNA